MARGFESKMVEFQQEEAQKVQKRKAAMTPEEHARHTRRRGLELARSRAAADLERATVLAHRQMLEQAIAALDQQLAEL